MTACFNINHNITQHLVLVFVCIFFLSAALPAQVFENKISVDTLEIVPVMQQPGDFNNDAYMEIMARVKISPENEGIALIFNKGRV